MFRRLQFTFPEGAIFISCADQKLLTLDAIHHFLSTKSIKVTNDNEIFIVRAVMANSLSNFFEKVCLVLAWGSVNSKQNPFCFVKVNFYNYTLDILGVTEIREIL